MGRTKKVESSESRKKIKPALTPEARETRMISLAMDRAEEALLNGTASNSMILHFLKLGSIKEQYEKEKLESDIELQKIKAQTLVSAQKADEMYINALNAFRSYSGHRAEVDEDEQA